MRNFDIGADDVVQLLFRETVMLGKHLNEHCFQTIESLSTGFSKTLPFSFVVSFLVQIALASWCIKNPRDHASAHIEAKLIILFCIVF